MDSAARWHTLKCAGSEQDSKIMLPRFRPIAPKPVVNDPFFGSSRPNYGNGNNSCNKRTKRKYVRVSKNNGYKGLRRVAAMKNECKETEDDSITHSNVVTLQLLPEKTDQEISVSCIGKQHCMDDVTIEKHGDPREMMLGLIEDDLTVGMADLTAVESWVTVECVTDACKGEITRDYHLVMTDDERVRRLDSDTCPGFVSDCWNNVKWVNGAYKRMVRVAEGKGVGQSSESSVYRVWLVVKDHDQDKLLSYSALTCRVRVQWGDTWTKEMRQMIVPCDVWRIDGGGFAWRLDVEAALCLGRC